MDKLQDMSAPIGRLFLSIIFIFSGFSKIMGYAATAGYIESVGVPSILLPLVIALELLGGIAILIGFKARLISLLFVGFNIVSALIFHQFWNDESQMNPFMKNIAMAGGFLMIFAHGPGAYSVDKDHAPRVTLSNAKLSTVKSINVR